jgi:serine/threonine-protein kinase
VLATPAAAGAAGADATTAMAAADSTQAIPAATATTPAAGPDGQGPNRRTGAYVVLLLVLLALLAGGLFLLAHELGLGSSSGADVIVPTVIGKSQGDATTTLKGEGLQVKVASAQNDAPAGQVFDQNPKPEAKTKKGDTVTISVSSGPQMVAVPDLVGQTQDDATNALDQLGLTEIVRQQNSDQPSGTVVSQDPRPGTQVAKNSSVTLTVSSGSGQVVVPNVVGQDAGTAGNVLGNAGFHATTKTQGSDTVQAGVVISTNPAGGAKAAKGSTVTMVVSSGPSPTTTEPATTTTQQSSGTATVPDVTGRSRAGANAALTAAGFSPSASANCNSPGATVQSQNPQGGTTATKGSTVFFSC